MWAALKKIGVFRSYAKLLTGEKATYSRYRTARDEMRELLTVKANVDHIMGIDQRGEAQEKGQSQR